MPSNTRTLKAAADRVVECYIEVNMKTSN